jgi:hypothetical protein
MGSAGASCRRVVECGPNSTIADRGNANFYEKALFVKPTWRPRCVANSTALCRSRYATIRTFGEPHSLWWLGAFDEILLVGLQEALQSSERSLLLAGVDHVRNLHSHLMIDPKRIQASRGLCRFSLGSLPYPDLYLLSLCALATRPRLLLSRQICAPMGVVE